jgi:hypothetical protein
MEPCCPLLIGVEFLVFCLGVLGLRRLGFVVWEDFISFLCCLFGGSVGVMFCELVFVLLLEAIPVVPVACLIDEVVQ